ncbi:MAG: thioredoxin domain-containing protein [Candidatus Nitrosothermus koennekii]|nr:MAG: thioredoxin domain-containing protein [Candidatus Nitrosothermus koennekii]
MSKRLNRLAKESSPYLLQHADNPVDWYPWSEEALKRAKEEDKPIFLSIGYSACHWCHVMEHESFENEEIAEIMNKHFINIKVDREERPDIDEIYQRVCQLATGTGGWPLSVFLTPDLKPFYVGTYFPPEDRYSMPGFKTLLQQLAEAWRYNRDAIEKQAEQIVKGLKQLDEFAIKGTDSIDKSILDEAAVNLLQSADTINGGFGPAPKFPNSMLLSFMLRYYRFSNISKFKEFVFLTLDKMSEGGIYDQIGGGFHRYSTDSKWLVPHFEKMLYDNALLPIVYAEAYQLSKDQRYAKIVRETLDYVIREMRSDEGGFYSTQDADSEGVEGKYYTFTKDEIYKLLDKRDAEIICKYYGITEEGNFEGRNILHISTSIDKIAKELGLSIDEVRDRIENSKKILLDAREKRVKPARDEKIITSWNSLMISAFIKGYRITFDDRYYNIAKDAIEFIANKLSKDYELMHVYKDGKAKIHGYLDDYAFYISALLDMFEIDSKAEYLDHAINYANYMLEHFSNDDLYYTSDKHEEIITRPKSIYDLSIPSGTSIAMQALLRLYHYTQEDAYLKKAISIMKRYATLAAENPFAFGALLNGIYLYVKKPIEIVLITKDGNAKRWLLNRYIPEGIIAVTDEIEDLRKFAFFKDKAVNDKLTAYVCKEFRCSLPLHSIKEMEEYISSL